MQIASVQKKYGPSGYTKQQVRFGAVDLKGYNRKMLEQAIKSDYSKFIHTNPEGIDSASKSLSDFLIHQLAPIIKKFATGNKNGEGSDVLKLAVVKDKKGVFHELVASVTKADGKPSEHKETRLRLLSSEKEFLDKVRKW